MTGEEEEEEEEEEKKLRTRKNSVGFYFVVHIALNYLPHNGFDCMYIQTTHDNRMMSE